MNLNSFYKYIFVFVISLFVLTGCGGNGSSGGESNGTAPSTEQNGSVDDNGSSVNTNDENSSNSVIEQNSSIDNVESNANAENSSSNSNGGESNSVSKETITGYVIDDPIQNANISIFTTDGKLLKENIKSDTNGYFEIKLDDVPDEYIVYSSGGEMNGTAFDGELFAFCQSSTCNITPLSTVTYQYANSLLNGTFTEKYTKAQKTVTEYLGISDDDIHKISGVSSFKFDVFRKLAKNEGFAVVIGGLVNDLVDGYIDEENNQKLFSSYLARVELPLPSEVELVKDEEGKDVTLTVHGANGTDHSKGFLIDVVATKKSTVVNDDAKEVEEDQTVFLGLNLGEYKGKLNSETTVLAKLFMSDMGLALLPNDAKESLIQQLKTENSELYTQTIDLYKFVVKEGTFYEPLFDEKFDLLVGQAQILINKNLRINNKLKQVESDLRKQQKEVFLYKSYRSNKIKKLEKRLSSYLNIEYDSEKNTFKFSNKLPIFFAIRSISTKPTEWYTYLTSPLINATSGGGLGTLASKSDTLVSFANFIGSDKLVKSTIFKDYIISSKLFPSGEKIANGYEEFEIFKNSFDIATIKNVGLGFESIIRFLSGSGASKKFSTAMENIKDGLGKFKEGLGYAQTGVNVAKTISNFLTNWREEELNYYYKFKKLSSNFTNNLTEKQIDDLVKNEISLLSDDEQEKVDKKYKDNTIKEIKEKFDFSKSLTEDDVINFKAQLKASIKINKIVTSASTYLSTIKNIIPDPSSLDIKDEVGFFASTVNTKTDNTKTNIIHAFINLRNSNTNSKFPISKGNLISVIVGGNILSKLISPFEQEETKIKTIFGLDNKVIQHVGPLKNKLKNFKDTYGISYKDFASIWIASKLGYKKGFSQKKLAKVYSDVAGKKKSVYFYKKAKNEFENIFSSTIYSLRGASIPILEKSITSLLSFASTGKLINSIQNMKTTNILSGIGKIIVKEVQKNGGKFLRGIVEDVSKQAILALASGGSSLLIKAGKAVPLANDLAGLGYGMYGTPSSIPFALKIKNGKLSYEYPKINVNNNYNSIIPINNEYIFNTSGSNSFMVVTDKASTTSSLYDLSYKLSFGNTKSSLSGIYDNYTWKDNIAIKATLSLRKFKDDKINGVAEKFSSNPNNEVEWTISPSEVSNHLKQGTNYTTLDLVDVLKEQNTKWYLRLIATNDSSTIVQNKTRGIWEETFKYRIYEPKETPLSGKSTKIDNYARYVFKIANAKDLRKGIKLYKYDDSHVAITNNTGHGIIVYNNLEEYYLANGETKLYVKNFFHSIKIADSILKEYGKSKGLKSLDSTIDYLSTIKDDFDIDYIVKANKIDSAKEYSCILRVEQDSFTDAKPNENINIVKSDDFLSILKNSKLKTVLYYDNVQQAYSYLYPLVQYHIDSEVKFPTSNIHFSNEKSSSIITTAIPNSLNGSVLNGNYKIKDLSNFTMNVEQDEYERISYVSFVKGDIKIDSMITEYEHTEDGDRMILEIYDGSKNFFECIKEKCSEFPKRGDSIYLLLSTIKNDFTDSDKDDIIDGLDMFPDNDKYQSDSDMDGMPDKWETQYGLNPNGPTDATKDLNGNGVNNLQEFADGSNPKNHQPTANAGANQTIKEGESVTLDASGSSDVDGDELSYEWKEKGDDEIIETEETLVLDDLSVGEYVYVLTVSDGNGGSDSVEVKVTVESSSTDTLKNGLVAHYKFDEQDGATTLIDSSGNHNDGTIHGGVTFVDGVIGKAGRFDGVDDYILVPNSSTFPSDAITISYWINRDSLPNGLNNYISKELAFQSYLLDNGSFESGFWKGSAGQWSGYLVNSNIENNLNKWILYTLTFDNQYKEAKSYINGALVDSKIETDVNAYLRTSNEPMYIGRNGSQDVYYIQGKLDDLRIYNRALTDAEIKALYEKGSINNGILQVNGNFLKNNELTFKYNYDGTDCSIDFRDGTRKNLDTCQGTTTHAFSKEWVYGVELKSDGVKIATTTVNIDNINNNWIGFVGSLNSYVEDNEKTSDIIKSGRIYLAPSFSSKSYYWTNYRFIKPNVLSSVSGDNFILEARIKNPSSEGGISCYDPSLRIIGEEAKQAWVTFMSAGCTYYSSIGAVDSYDSGGYSSSVPSSDLSVLGQDFSDWKTIKLEVKNHKVSAYYEGTKLYTKEYLGQVGKIYGIAQSFKGSGSIDWIKLYNGDGQLVYSEDFN